MITYFQKDNVKVFMANDPNSLVAYLDRRSRTYDYYKNKILSDIPRIRSLSQKYVTQKPIGRYLEGLESINTLLFQLLMPPNSPNFSISLKKNFN